MTIFLSNFLLNNTNNYCYIEIEKLKVSLNEENGSFSFVINVFGKTSFSCFYFGTGECGPNRPQGSITFFAVQFMRREID